MNEQSSGLQTFKPAQACCVDLGLLLAERDGFWFRRLRMDNASVENILQSTQQWTRRLCDVHQKPLGLDCIQSSLGSAPAASGSVYRRFKCHLGSAASDLVREGGRWLTQLWSSATAPQHTLIQKVRSGQTNLIFLVRPRGLGTESTGMLNALADWQERRTAPFSLFQSQWFGSSATSQAQRTARFLLGAEDEPVPCRSFRCDEPCP